MGKLIFKKAVDILRHGGVIAYPTEAVFGLGCDPLNESAVLRLLTIKNRPVSKGLLIIASDFNQLSEFVAPLGAEIMLKINKSWPGPTTWVLPARSNTPYWLIGDHAGIAVRVTAHPIAATLCEAFGGPIVSTSANQTGRAPCRTCIQTRHRFTQEVDYIMPGQTQGLKKPTQIKNALSNDIIRSA